MQFFGVGNFAELSEKNKAMIEESHIAYYDGTNDLHANTEASAHRAGGVEGQPAPGPAPGHATEPEPAPAPNDNTHQEFHDREDASGDFVYYHAEDVGRSRTAELRAQHERIGTARAELSAGAAPVAGAAPRAGRRKMGFRRRSEYTPRRVGAGSWEAGPGACRVLSVAGGYCFSIAVVERAAEGAVVREAWAWGMCAPLP
jgi:hypothetical protein